MNRRQFIKRIAVGLVSVPFAGCLSNSKTNPAVANKPNIVLILIDDMGYMDLGCYNSTFYETPNIDALASEGMLFTNAYSACPVCSPTRASLMTGKDTARVNFTGHITAIGRHRHPENSRIIPPKDKMYLDHKEITLAEALKSYGYTSASIGKWHLGSEDYWPEKQGFDINIAGWTHGSPPSYFYPYTRDDSKWNASIPTLKGGKEGEYLTDRLTDEAVNFINDNKDKPFFLYLTHYAVHTPLQAPEKLVKKYEQKLQKDTSQKNAVYAAMIENLDNNVGKVLRTIEQLNLEDNTIVIFASDNGGLAKVTNNAPLRAGKGFLYEGGIRVPMLIKWPAKIKAQTLNHTPVTTEDIYPTITEFVSGSTASLQDIDGQSLVPLLTGSGTFNKDHPIFWYYPHYSPQAKQPGAAVRLADYKLIEFYDPPKLELYNLNEDVSEKNNLAEKMPEKTAELRKLLNDFLKSAQTIMHAPNPNYKNAK